MVIQALAGAALKSVAKKSAKALLVESMGEKKAAETLRSIKTAQQRARRAEGRLTQALELLNNPQATVTKSARKLAGELTQAQIERELALNRELRAGLRAGAEGYAERVVQNAAFSNRVAAQIREAKLTAREAAAYDQLRYSKGAAKPLWAYINKKISKAPGHVGRLATIEDIKAVGGSKNLETAINNIFTEYFNMTWEEALEKDAVNNGPDELYNMLQYTIASAKPMNMATYSEESENGWYTIR